MSDLANTTKHVASALARINVCSFRANDHAYGRRLRRQFAGSAGRQARARTKRGGALEIDREIRR